MINRRALNSIRKWKFAIIIEMTRIRTENTRQRFWISQKLTFGNLVGFSTYSSDFDYWPGHVGRPPTGLPPSSFRVKWGKGDEHQFLPALVTKLMDGTFICCSWFIQNWLCPKTFDPPLPPQKCSKLFRQSLREIVQKCCDFSATFSVEKKHSPSPHFGQIPKESVFSLIFLYPLLQLQKSVSSTLRNTENIWGTRGKKRLENPQEVWICTSVKIEIQFPWWNMNLHRLLQ